MRPPAQSGNAGRQFGEDMECLVEPSLVTSLGSPVEGTLAEVLVDRGAVVTKGQVGPDAVDYARLKIAHAARHGSAPARP